MATTTYSPKALIDKYNKMVENRGYGYFSQQSVNAWQQKMKDSNKSLADIHKEIEKDTEDYMTNVRNMSAYKHAQFRQEFLNRFGSSEAQVKEHMKYLAYKKYDVGGMPSRDRAYESRMLSKNNYADLDDWGQDILSQVLRAKWDASGYLNDLDVITEFRNNYCKKK